MSRSWSVRGRAVLGLALCVGGSGLSTAASLSLVPVRIALTATQPISALSVHNDGDEPAVVQLEVARWTQAEGKSVYAATTDILATPPIFTIEPGASQLVRIGLRRSVDADRELSYRLFLQEVPPPTAGGSGLRMALRFVVPVFVAPASAKANRPTQVSALEWHAFVVPGRMTLTAINAGNTHVQVIDFTLTERGAAAPLAQRKLAEYLLPDQHRDWQIELSRTPAAGSPLHLSAQTDAGGIEADLTVESP